MRKTRRWTRKTRYRGRARARAHTRPADDGRDNAMTRRRTRTNDGGRCRPHRFGGTGPAGSTWRVATGRGIIRRYRPLYATTMTRRRYPCAAGRQRFLLTCVALLLIGSWLTAGVTAGRYVSNLSGNCMRCLCHASTQCNATVGCSQGYCGPYYLNRNYWKDAGQPVLHDDDPERDQAFVDCAVDAACALRAVESYMAKWGRDCNKDGVTDCDDYARTHFNGREDCTAIDKTNFWRRYVTCRPTSNGGKFY